MANKTIANSSSTKAEVSAERQYDAWKKEQSNKPSIGDKNTNNKK